MTDELQALLDREQIKDVRHRFALALDTRDWELLASVFTDDIEVDLSAVGVPAATTRRTDLVRLYQQSFRRPRKEMGTQQLYSNFVIDIHGDTATCGSYLLGSHHVPGLDDGEDVELRARYSDRLVRTADGWKITATTLEVFSLVGNPAILT